MNDSPKKAPNPERKAARQRLLWPLIIIVAFTIIRMVQGSGHRVEAALDDELLALSVDSYAPVFIPLEDIRTVTLLETLGGWELLDGASDEKFISGSCHTESCGNARLFAYIDVPAFIAIETSNETLIYNLSTVGKTEKDYQKLLDSINP